MTISSDNLVSAPGSEMSTGRRRVLVSIVLVWFTTYFVRLAWVNISASASHTLGSSAAELASFITFFFVGYVVANVTGGFLVDRLGARRVVSTALMLLALAVFCFSQVTTPMQGWCIQFVMGLSCGSFYAAVIKVVAAWYAPNERGSASGLLFVAGPFAVIAANLVYPSIISTFDWRMLYVLLSVYVLLVALGAAFFIRNGRTTVPKINVGTIGGAAAAGSAPILNINTFLLCGACFGTGWGTWGFTFCSNMLLVRGNLGLTEGAAAAVALWFGIGGVVIIPVYGFLSDRFRGKRTELYIAELLLMIVALFMFSSQTSLFGFCTSAFFLGATAYAFLPVLGALLPDVVRPGTLGATAGISNAAGQLAAAIAPVVIGLILDRTGSVTMSLLTLAIGPILGVLCLTSLLMVNRRRASQVA